jgi:hypothetical protein
MTMMPSLKLARTINQGELTLNLLKKIKMKKLQNNHKKAP